MSIKEAVAKLAARANADGYGLTYTVSSGKKSVPWSCRVSRSVCRRRFRTRSSSPAAILA